MEKEAAKSLEVVQHLFSNDPGKLGIGALRGHRGCAFMHSVKGALGLGFEKGSGVLVKVLSMDDDVPNLSPPLPLRTSKLGVGLQLGFDKVFSAVLLDSDEDVAAVATGDVVVGRDVDLQGYVDQSLSNSTYHKETMMHLNPSKPQPGPKVVSVSDSYMICDFSAYGGTLGPDMQLLHEMYGPSTTVEDVLAGRVRRPECFEPLYEFLIDRFYTTPKKHIVVSND